MKYLLTISYDGSKYHGLQKLNGYLTIQGELENVLSRIDEKNVKVKSASRTDRGVHALNQKCQFELIKPLTPFRLRYYINRTTSAGLYVKKCEILPDNSDFHVRFSAKAKVYLYRINIGEYDPLINNYIYNYCKTLNLEKMKKCSKLLIGEHNYKVFVTNPIGSCESYIEYINFENKNDIVEIEIKGRSFYTHMVRNIIGVLIYVSIGKISESDFAKMIQLQERIHEYRTAPACGLYLKEVIY